MQSAPIHHAKGPAIISTGIWPTTLTHPCPSHARGHHDLYETGSRPVVGSKGHRLITSRCPRCGGRVLDAPARSAGFSLSLGATDETGTG